MVNRDREREREIIVGMGGMSINSNAGSMRPPAQPKASGSIGRAGGSNYHPGLGRISTTNSIPQQKDMVKTPISMERSQSNTQYPRIVERTVELRQAPPAGPLPPPPVPRKESGGRQATYPPHSERQSQNANANYYPSRALYEEADRQARGGY